MTVQTHSAGRIPPNPDPVPVLSQGGGALQQRRGGAAGRGPGPLRPGGGPGPEGSHSGRRVCEEAAQTGALSVVRGAGVPEARQHGGRWVQTWTGPLHWW